VLVLNKERIGDLKFMAFCAAIIDTLMTTFGIDLDEEKGDKLSFLSLSVLTLTFHLISCTEDDKEEGFDFKEVLRLAYENYDWLTSVVTNLIRNGYYSRDEYA